jgi:hypothetical protein
LLNLFLAFAATGGGRAELGQQEHHGNQLHRHWFKYVSVRIFSVTLVAPQGIRQREWPREEEAEGKQLTYNLHFSRRGITR